MSVVMLSQAPDARPPVTSSDGCLGCYPPVTLPDWVHWPLLAVGLVMFLACAGLFLGSVWELVSRRGEQATRSRDGPLAGFCPEDMPAWQWLLLLGVTAALGAGLAVSSALILL